jgi:hypothetical protein
LEGTAQVKRHNEMAKMVPLAHTKAAVLPVGWMPTWSAKKDRQLARRVARAMSEMEQRNRRIKVATKITAPNKSSFLQQIADRARRFFSRRTA